MNNAQNYQPGQQSNQPKQAPSAGDKTCATPDKQGKQGPNANNLREPETAQRAGSQNGSQNNQGRNVDAAE